MGETIEQWIQQLAEAAGLEGYFILLITIPLAVVQGFLGFYPFATIIVVHIASLGLIGGMLASWLAGTVAAIVVFMVCRYLFYDYFQRRWGHRLDKYGKWQRHLDMYGIWLIIFLRTLPVMPNNLISFMAAISPIKPGHYIWSSILGNLSHIWLFGLISSSVILPDTEVTLFWFGYIGFCALLAAVFAVRHYTGFKKYKARIHDRKING
jgi:uncharacterized membrane protein YdjX (TVP38/TMEM64 family)